MLSVVCVGRHRTRVIAGDISFQLNPQGMLSPSFAFLGALGLFESAQAHIAALDLVIYILRDARPPHPLGAETIGFSYGPKLHEFLSLTIMSQKVDAKWVI